MQSRNGSTTLELPTHYSPPQARMPAPPAAKHTMRKRAAQSVVLPWHNTSSYAVAFAMLARTVWRMPQHRRWQRAVADTLAPVAAAAAVSQAAAACPYSGPASITAAISKKSTAHRWPQGPGCTRGGTGRWPRARSCGWWGTSSVGQQRAGWWTRKVCSGIASCSRHCCSVVAWQAQAPSAAPALPSCSL